MLLFKKNSSLLDENTVQKQIIYSYGTKFGELNSQENLDLLNLFATSCSKQKPGGGEENC